MYSTLAAAGWVNPVAMLLQMAGRLQLLMLMLMHDDLEYRHDKVIAVTQEVDTIDMNIVAGAPSNEREISRQFP
jgi:isocitrate/isopropylmalate dehydrogenase